MKNLRLRNYVAIACALFVTFFLCACSNANNAETTTKPDAVIEATVTKNPKFDSAVLSVNADDFTNAGFAFGDSCDVEFSNGTTFTDIPYFNGYYVKTGDPVVVAYPKDDFVTIANNNRDMWTPVGLKDGDTVKVTLREKGKYVTTQEALSQSYSVERSDYSSDEQFSNFRSLKGGKLKDNFLFRGASPVDNSRGRAAITNSLIEKAGVKTVIDLADTEAEMNEYFAASDFSSTYAKNLYDSGADVVLAMSSNQDSQDYKTSFAKGLRLLLSNGGPAYIHCMEGKDRTGFVCMLIEAFAGATYDEMCEDYMQTYANYYGITKEVDPEKFDAIRSLYFDAFCEYLAGTSDADTLKSFDYTKPAEEYLSSCGLTSDEVSQLHSLIEN